MNNTTSDTTDNTMESVLKQLVKCQKQQLNLELAKVQASVEVNAISNSNYIKEVSEKVISIYRDLCKDDGLIECSDDYCMEN